MLLSMQSDKLKMWFATFVEGLDLNILFKANALLSLACLCGWGFLFLLLFVSVAFVGMLAHDVAGSVILKVPRTLQTVPKFMNLDNILPKIQ
jgi:hypothetical protein